MSLDLSVLYRTQVPIEGLYRFKHVSKQTGESIDMVHGGHTTGIDRRQALKGLSLILSAASSLPVLSGLSAEKLTAQAQSIHQHFGHKAQEETAGAGLPSTTFLNPHQDETVAVISELIIPQTATPGARAAKVNQFIDLFLSNAQAEFQQEFVEGLTWIDRRSEELFQCLFIKATPQEQGNLLTQISTDDSSEDSVGKTFIKRIKGLTVFGYYTSKEGMVEELGYQGAGYPGVYEGCTHPEHQV
jgi:glucoside 3-dehydrogenase (cytochrome c) hitch-hiker subunit